jgi:hypothetical protein
MAEFDDDDFCAVDGERRSLCEQIPQQDIQQSLNDKEHG